MWRLLSMIPQIFQKVEGWALRTLCHPMQNLRKGELVLGRMESVRGKCWERWWKPSPTNPAPTASPTEAGKPWLLCSQSSSWWRVEAPDQGPEKDSELLLAHVEETLQEWIISKSRTQEDRGEIRGSHLPRSPWGKTWEEGRAFDCRLAPRQVFDKEMIKKGTCYALASKEKTRCFLVLCLKLVQKTQGRLKSGYQ